MELRYTHINNDVTTATMYLNGIIGEELDSAQFVREMNYLDSLDINDITIKINSGGGSVFAGLEIVDAIMEDRFFITAHVVGLAASMAGVIAMAANKVVMNDFALLMLHNPSGGDDEILNKVKNSLITIFNKRTGVNEKFIDMIMEKETWYTADEAKMYGFIDEVANTSKRVQVDVSNTSLKEMYNIFNKINFDEMTENEVTDNTEVTVEETVVETVIEAVEETPAVEEIANAEDVPATEEIVEETVEEVVEETPAVENKYSIQIDVQNMEVVTEKLDQLQKENEELKNQIAELVKKEEDRLKALQDAREEEIVTNAIDSGKISNEVKTTWKNLLKLDFENTVKALDNIIVNKTAVDVTKVINKNAEVSNMTWDEVFRSGKAQELKEKSPALYNQLYFDKYKVYPSN
ncbi:Clp protease ClpP [Rufibacter ruber]|uniref:Clp protease ClpP n=1 Tax=Rufibacter ruber TaxID=1783499 RepID=UPI000832E70D|nr:Clp protease ClpP [Rufibacter ruber]